MLKVASKPQSESHNAKNAKGGTHQADRGSATAPLRRAAGALFVLRPDRKRASPGNVSPSARADLATLAAAKVAAPVPELGPVCQAHDALSASASQGRPLDLPSRSESMCLRSRMRESCTSGSVGGLGGQPPGSTRHLSFRFCEIPPMRWSLRVVRALLR